MPTITKIAQQKKRKDRYSIFLDEDYAFSVEEEVLVRFQLSKGQTLTESEINEITENDTFYRAYLMAIHYLSYRMRSINEMHTYLRKKEIDSVWIEQIIVKLIDEKLLNDLEFAKIFVRDRMHNTSKGPRFIEKELMEKGVKIQTAKQATSQYDKESQFSAASKWLEKEQRKKSQHSFRKRQDQLKLKLMQRGFDQEVITEIFQENKPVLDLESEQAIFIKQAEKLYRKYSRNHNGYELKMKIKQSLFQKGFQSDMIEEYIADLDNG